jgi:hypothetical protein
MERAWTGMRARELEGPKYPGLESYKGDGLGWLGWAALDALLDW